MKEQTYIAVFHDARDARVNYDFERFCCKRKETVLKQLRELASRSGIFAKYLSTPDLVCILYKTEGSGTCDMTNTEIERFNAIDLLNN